MYVDLSLFMILYQLFKILKIYHEIMSALILVFLSISFCGLISMSCMYIGPSV